jgi:hypothetical protein
VPAAGPATDIINNGNATIFVGSNGQVQGALNAGDAAAIADEDGGDPARQLGRCLSP